MESRDRRVRRYKREFNGILDELFTPEEAIDLREQNEEYRNNPVLNRNRKSTMKKEIEYHRKSQKSLKNTFDQLVDELTPEEYQILEQTIYELREMFASSSSALKRARKEVMS